MRASILISIIIAVAAALWVGSAIIFPPEDDNGTTAQSAPETAAERAGQDRFQVRTKVFTAQPVIDFATVTGRTHPYRSVDISGEINARVEEVLVDEGARVDKGDVLARLDVAERQARVEEARQTLNQREIEYDAASSLKKRGFSSDIRLAETRAAYEAARAALTAAEKALGNTEITAPFAGMINEQMIEVGDYVSPGGPMFTLVQLDPVEIVGFVSERNILNVEEGRTAEAHFLDGSMAEGPVTFIAPSASQETRTFRVKMEAPNPDFEIRGGLTAEMKIPLLNKKGHDIPASILTLNDEGVMGVKFIDDQNSVQFQPVEIINSGPDNVTVTGLPDTVRLITVGGEFVGEGEVVSSRGKHSDEGSEK